MDARYAFIVSEPPKPFNTVGAIKIYLESGQAGLPVATADFKSIPKEERAELAIQAKATLIANHGAQAEWFTF